ncbi:MAG: hypothetical protein A2Z14_06135 [Chloroflexi bacterium RBG_16_48_8]|nr:MAG: hypothetical protein A2Z14_06135 [Chloroflexi bacterium RBG_16_48_8]
MKIRAITGFLDPGWPIEPDRLGHIADCLKHVRENLSEAGYEVQTLRLATPPLSEMTSIVRTSERPDFARQLEAECFVQGMDYAALGPVLAGDIEGFEAIPEVLRTTESVFTSALFADIESGLSLSMARGCAEVIHQISTITPDGFTNLRFAALANVASGSPFFPAAYHRGGPPALAIATEAADLAVAALHDNSSAQSASRVLVEAIEGHAAVLSRISQSLAAQHNVRFWGIDFSLAPFPEELRSLGAAIQALGVPGIGHAGSAAAASFLAFCLDKAQFHRTGFCGLFFPVLEDSVLAKDASEGFLTLKDLLLFATICGTGLDTIPLSGDISQEALYALILDLGALALRHDKPLTARLMPIPGKQVGDEIHFNFPYFASSRIMAVDYESLDGILSTSESIEIRPRDTPSGTLSSNP